MMPRLAALSIAEIIACTSLASGFEPGAETPFCILRRRVSTLRLRSERTVVWRARFEADLVLAIWKLEISERGGSWRAGTVSRPRSCAAGGKLRAPAEVRLLRLCVFAHGLSRLLCGSRCLGLPCRSSGLHYGDPGLHGRCIRFHGLWRLSLGLVEGEHRPLGRLGNVW